MSVDPGWQNAVTLGASPAIVGAWKASLGGGARLAEWQVAAMVGGVTPAKAGEMSRAERRALVAAMRRGARKALRHVRKALR